METYGPQGLKVIAINPDSQDYTDISAVAAFVNGANVTYPVAVQETALTPTYTTLEIVHDGANPYPVDILIDKQGVMRYLSREYDPPTLHEKIQELLAE